MIMTQYTLKIHKWLFPNVRTTIITSILSLLFSGFTVAGYLLHSRNSLWISFKVLALIGVLWVLFYGALSALWKFDDRHRVRSIKILPKRYFILSILFIAVCWVLVWLASWPGYYVYDTGAFSDYLNSGQLSNWQSVFHTLVVSTVIRIGKFIFGSYNGGVALYLGMQMLFVLALTAVMLYFLLYKQRCGLPVFIVSVLFLGLSPSISMFALCSTKDTMFPVVLLAWVLLFTVSIQQDNVIKSPVYDIALFLLTFLVCAYRNNGAYIIIALLPFAFFLIHTNKGEKWKKSAILSIICIVGVAASLIWSGPVATTLNAKKQNPLREMISIPTIQLARAATDSPSIDHDGLAKLGVDSNTLAYQYQSFARCTDPMRALLADSIDQGGHGPEMLHYYLSQFPNHERSYVIGPLVLTDAAWSPFAFIRGYNDPYRSTFDYNKTESSIFAAVVEAPAKAHSFLPGLSNILWKYSRSNPFHRYPAFAWTSMVSFFFWLTLLALARTLITRNRRGILISLLFLIAAGTSLLGPMVLIRYYWFMFLGAPMLLTFSLESSPMPLPEIEADQY